MNLHRDGNAATKHPALGIDGMVCSSHPSVSAVGARVLADGGNAIDATLAMAALSWMTLPAMCGLGGDAFAVVREPDGRVWTVGGSGFGPDGGDGAFYREQGLPALPDAGALSVAVPGAPAALATLQASGATRGLDELWAPAIQAAERGVPCTTHTRVHLLDCADAIGRDAATAAILLPAGAPPRVGDRIVQAELAATMRSLAGDLTAFYTGSFAERAVRALVDAGAPYSGDEWAAGADAPPQPAVTGRYRDRVVHVTPVPSPGWMVLQQLALCDGELATLPWLGRNAVHWMASAATLAFEDRYARIGSDNDAWRSVLHPSAVVAGKELIRSRVGTRRLVDVRGGDTTSHVVVDADGRAVSFIHSLAFAFGAKFTVPGTGVLLNNRLGRGAYLVPGHPNEVCPRRRPMHTLNAWIVTDDNGRLLHVGNTPGGDGQVQWNVQLLSHLLDHGMNPQQAVDAPRFMTFPGSDADSIGKSRRLRCESRLGEETLAGLAGLGHRVDVLGPWAGGGSAQVISVDATGGCLSGGSDPREDGVALGV